MNMEVGIYIDELASSCQIDLNFESSVYTTQRLLFAKSFWHQPSLIMKTPIYSTIIQNSKHSIVSYEKGGIASPTIMTSNKTRMMGLFKIYLINLIVTFKIYKYVQVMKFKY